MKEKVLSIIHYWGIENQKRKFVEEMLELTDAITEYEFYKNNFSPFGVVEDKKLKDHITEELADCMLLLKQIELYYDIDKDSLKDTTVYKIDRTLERIEKLKNMEE